MLFLAESSQPIPSNRGWCRASSLTLLYPPSQAASLSNIMPSMSLFHTYCFLPSLDRKLWDSSSLSPALRMMPGKWLMLNKISQTNELITDYMEAYSNPSWRHFLLSAVGSTKTNVIRLQTSVSSQSRVRVLIGAQLIPEKGLKPGLENVPFGSEKVEINPGSRDRRL